MAASATERSALLTNGNVPIRASSSSSAFKASSRLGRCGIGGKTLIGFEQQLACRIITRRFTQRAIDPQKRRLHDAVQNRQLPLAAAGQQCTGNLVRGIDRLPSLHLAAAVHSHKLSGATERLDQIRTRHLN